MQIKFAGPFYVGIGQGQRIGGGCLTMLTLLAVSASTVNAQVRGKKPDRGVYQSPVIDTAKLETIVLEDVSAVKSSLGQSSLGQSSLGQSSLGQSSTSNQIRRVSRSEPLTTLQPIDQREVRLVDPTSESDQPAASRPSESARTIDERSDEFVADTVGYESMTQPPVIMGGIYEDQYRHEGHYIDETSLSCDTIDGCDSMCGSSSWSNAFICFDRDNWFGSVELLLMFRKGDRLPALVTTGDSVANGGTTVLVGEDRILEDMTAGGRVTIGTWIDSQQNRSLVLRGWAAGEETFNFARNQNQTSILGRPFLDLTPGNPPAGLQVIADGVTNTTDFGSINVSASSNVYGGDFSIRQYWYGKYGASVDFLYGYQFMRFDEDLRITSQTLAGTTQLDVTDSIQAENEFHGGQFGVATNYREGCWSFSGLLKVGFGALERRTILSGRTEVLNGPPPSNVDPQGLLVRNTNSGTVNDHTFAWVPELDLTWGYRRFPCYELTFGYHIVALTDAIQTSGILDPQLASNLSDPFSGDARPARAFDDETFYVQGIHFGLEYVY